MELRSRRWRHEQGPGGPGVDRPLARGPECGRSAGLHHVSCFLPAAASDVTLRLAHSLTPRPFRPPTAPVGQRVGRTEPGRCGWASVNRPQVRCRLGRRDGPGRGRPPSKGPGPLASGAGAGSSPRRRLPRAAWVSSPLGGQLSPAPLCRQRARPSARSRQPHAPVSTMSCWLCGRRHSTRMGPHRARTRSPWGHLGGCRSQAHTHKACTEIGVFLEAARAAPPAPRFCCLWSCRRNGREVDASRPRSLPPAGPGARLRRQRWFESRLTLSLQQGARPAPLSSGGKGVAARGTSRVPALRLVLGAAGTKSVPKSMRNTGQAAALRLPLRTLAPPPRGLCVLGC